MICTGLTRGYLSNVAKREWSTSEVSEVCIYIGNYEELRFKTMKIMKNYVLRLRRWRLAVENK